MNGRRKQRIRDEQTAAAPEMTTVYHYALVCQDLDCLRGAILGAEPNVRHATTYKRDEVTCPECITAMVIARLTSKKPNWVDAPAEEDIQEELNIQYTTYRSK